MPDLESQFALLREAMVEHRGGQGSRAGGDAVKTLIVEDELTSRVLLRELLKRFGPPHVAMNGTEAVEAVRVALQAGEPFDLICLDIMMPEMDGQEALKRIRQLEEEAGLDARTSGPR